jgi:hypothetical protein
MNYPWPSPNPDPMLEEALNIALDYLAASEQEKLGDSTRNRVASIIFTAWQEGIRHRIQLANVAIVAVQQLEGSPRNQQNETLKLGAVTDLAGISLPP